jgi:hypothetical protein
LRVKDGELAGIISEIETEIQEIKEGIEKVIFHNKNLK